MISDLTPISAPGTTELTTANSDTNQTDKVIAPASLSSDAGSACLPPVRVPQGTILLQPVTDIAAHLKSRAPVQYWEQEQSLFSRLPGELRAEVRSRQAACELVLRLVKAGLKVQPACKAALATFRDRHFQPTRFRALYDAWAKSKDWLVFVNRSKAGAQWQDVSKGLSDEFIKFCAGRIGKYKRDDARKEALRSVFRQWRTGKNLDGAREPIPGYGFATDWFRKKFPGKVMPVEMPLPQGWHYSNIMRQIKARNALPKASHALLLQGTAAAKEFVPDVLGTRVGLRFMEEVQFDDVKTDWRVFDPKTGQPMDLWLLIARDKATGMLLGFGMRPARVRDDGSQEHLKLRDMKQLCGWILERYGLPPYLMIWVIENGTATLSQASVAALQELLGEGRIHVRYGTMVGGTSPAGYFERRTGNSKSKASLESHNRTAHIIGAHLPGQTGPAYGKRPSDLTARENECKEIAQLSAFVPEGLRDELGYPLLTVKQARAKLFEIFTIQNTRTDHEMEGFDEVIEWYDEKTGLWMRDGLAPVAAKIRQRMESPVERAAKLSAPFKDGWKRVSPEIVTAFYDHSQREVHVEASGEIHIKHEKTKLIFVSPQPSTVLSASNNGCRLRLLAYFNPHDPTFLYLTDGKGGIVGVWLLRARSNDKDAVAQAIAYQARAMRSARELAEELCAPERASLDEMRARNEALVDQHGFVDVAQIDASHSSHASISSPVAAGLRGIERQREKTRQRVADDAELARLASEALMESHS